MITNVVSNLLAKFNKYFCFKFFYNCVKKNNSRKWRSPKFTVKAKCMMEGCPVVAKNQQWFSDEIHLEEKVTIQFDGAFIINSGMLKYVKS